CGLTCGLVCGCSPTVTGSSRPTCMVTVTPSSGGVQTLFTTTLTSTDAATCIYGLDGKRMIPVECNRTFMATGADVGDVGTHNLLVTATGQGGTGTCEASWTVLPFMADLGGAPPDMAMNTSPPDLAMNMMPEADLATIPDLAKPPNMLDLHDCKIHNNPPNL